MAVTIKMRRPRAIILDIEGTTTSVRFVAEILFPYIKTHIKKYLNERWGQPEVILTVNRLRQQALTDKERGYKVPMILNDDEADSELVKRSVIGNILWQMEEKRNNAALKQIQILIWVYGYEKQHIRGHVFDDVPPALHFWKNNCNIKLFLYSTGMIVVQQLLFSCSTHGNLLPLVDDCFDVLVGSKRDPRSFLKIGNIIEEHESTILFLTDSPKEARAAIHAGCKAILVNRPGNKHLSHLDPNYYRIIRNFSDIIFYD